MLGVFVGLKHVVVLWCFARQRCNGFSPCKSWVPLSRCWLRYFPRPSNVIDKESVAEQATIYDEAVVRFTLSHGRARCGGHFWLAPPVLCVSPPHSSALPTVHVLGNPEHQSGFLPLREMRGCVSRYQNTPLSWKTNVLHCSHSVDLCYFFIKSLYLAPSGPLSWLASSRREGTGSVALTSQQALRSSRSPHFSTSVTPPEWTKNFYSVRVISEKSSHFTSSQDVFR